MKIHELKTDPIPFQATKLGLKPYEVRFNDRDFKTGDELILKETKYTGGHMFASPDQYPLIYTGRELVREIAHVLTGYGLADGWVILTVKDPGAVNQESAFLERHAIPEPGFDFKQLYVHQVNQTKLLQKTIDSLEMQLKRVQPVKSKDGKVSVYHKPCPHCGGLIDVYAILEMFGPISHSIGHAIKKLLVLGKRIGGKSADQDAKEAIWSINRWLEDRNPVLTLREACGVDEAKHPNAEGSAFTRTVN